MSKFRAMYITCNILQFSVTSKLCHWRYRYFSINCYCYFVYRSNLYRENGIPSYSNINIQQQFKSIHRQRAKSGYNEPHVFNKLRLICASTAALAILGELVKAFPSNEFGLAYQHFSLTLCWYSSFIIRAIYIFMILHKISIFESDRKLSFRVGVLSSIMYLAIMIFWFVATRRYIYATGFPATTIPEYGFILDLVFTLLPEILIISTTAKIVKMQTLSNSSNVSASYFKSAKAFQFFKYMVVQACVVSVVIVTINLYNFFLYDYTVSNHLYSLQMYILPFSLALFEKLLKDSDKKNVSSIVVKGGKGSDV